MQLSTADTSVIVMPAYLFPEMPSPFSSLVRVDFSACSHLGLRRQGNEDSYLIFRTGRVWERLATSLDSAMLPERFEENGYLMAVADGMGGHQAGEVASSLALRKAVTLVLNAAHWALKLDNPEQRQQQLAETMERGRMYFQEIHRTVAGHANSDPALARMGTTLTATYSFGTDLFVLHVGDSRAYLFREGKLKQLTHDHTLAQELVDTGVMSAEEAAGSRLHHVLTRAIGGASEDILPEVSHQQLCDGDILMVCSDGLTGMVSDEQITQMLCESVPVEQMCQALIDAALEGGGKDNITVLLGRYHIPQREKSERGERE